MLGPSVALLAWQSMASERLATLRARLWESSALRPSLRIRWLLEEDRKPEALAYASELLENLYAREAPISALGVVEEAIEGVAELGAELGEVRERLWLAYVRCVLAVRPSDGVARKLFGQLSPEAEGEQVDIVRGYVSAELMGVIGHYPGYKERLVAAWEQHHDQRPSVSLLLIGMKLAWVEEQFGDLEKAAHWHDSLRSVVARLGRKSARAMVAQQRARLAFTKGQFDVGANIAEKALDALEGIQGVSTRASVLPVYVDYLRIQGRFSEALMHLSEALAAARSTEMPRLVVPLLLAAARCEVDLFRLGRAQEYVESHGEFTSRGVPPFAP